MADFAQIPLKRVGPIRIQGPILQGDFFAPLATYETPLFASCQRGAKISQACNGISVICLGETMTRSLLLEGPSAVHLQPMIEQIEHPDFFQRLNQAVRETSRYATLQEINCHLIGRQLFIRIHIHPGDASGHNMSTKAAENILKLLQSTYPELQYVSLSGNACSDKKVSAINSLLGRGKSMIAELVIPRAILQQLARTTPEKMVDINLKKNLLGSHVAGSVRSANAHVANTLLAFYLATGQDAANIVEGSQAITTCDLTQSGDLYFAVTLPNLIIGTVGNGKHLPAVQLELSKLPFPKSESPGHQSRQLAALCAASVLCSELSLLSALTNPEELMRAHILLERASSKENRQ